MNRCLWSPGLEEDEKEGPQGCRGGCSHETEVRRDPIPGGAGQGWGGESSPRCAQERERGVLGGSVEKVVLELHPWFSNLTAHPNHQRNGLRLECKPVRAEPQPVTATVSCKGSQVIWMRSWAENPGGGPREE